MANFYDRGDVIRMTASFTDIADTASDPSTVTLRIKQPDGSVAVHTYPGDITKDSTGAYHYDFSVSESGDHYYRYEGAGNVQAAAETLFHVRKSEVI